MNKYKHTPGPWTIAHHISYCDDYPMSKSTYVKIEDILIHIGACGGDIHNESIEANARLIASAPELLATIEHMTYHMYKAYISDDDSELYNDAKELYKSAIELIERIKNG